MECPLFDLVKDGPQRLLDAVASVSRNDTSCAGKHPDMAIVAPDVFPDEPVHRTITEALNAQGVRPVTRRTARPSLAIPLWPVTSGLGPISGPCWLPMFENNLSSVATAPPGARGFLFPP
jgi:hypothetical protein